MVATPEIASYASAHIVERMDGFTKDIPLSCRTASGIAHKSSRLDPRNSSGFIPTGARGAADFRGHGVNIRFNGRSDGIGAAPRAERWIEQAVERLGDD
jgi:hypothetical protein